MATVELHQPSGRWRLGLALTLLTVLLWATQPVAFKVALERVDPMTLVWGRFAFAGLALGGWITWRGQWRSFRGQGRTFWLLLGGAVLALLGNFILCMLGLKWTSPANAQLLSQASHPLVALAAIWLFRERFNRWQWLGILGIACGLGVFLAAQRAGAAPAEGRHYLLGSGMMLLAAALWPGFALTQKQLLRTLSASQITGFIYVLLAVAFLPFARPAALLGLDGVHQAAVAYCMLTTVAAYLAFAQAFDHWEASRVSTLCVTSPILTVAAAALVHRLAPGLLQAERITQLGWAGGALIVSGSGLSSLMRDRALDG